MNVLALLDRRTTEAGFYGDTDHEMIAALAAVRELIRSAQYVCDLLPTAEEEQDAAMQLTVADLRAALAQAIA